MTLINLQALQVRLGGLVGTDATLQLQCWADDGAAVRVSGADVIFPVLETVKLAAGVPAKPIDYPATLGTCCVKVTVRAGAFLLERYVAVPEAGPVDFDDLVDVDPSTFAPSVAAVTAWQAWRDAAELLAATAAAGATAAQASAAAAELDRIAAQDAAARADDDADRSGTSAFNAAGSAAASQSSEDDARDAAIVAKGHRDAAEGFKTSSESARDAAIVARDVALAGQMLGTQVPDTGQDFNTLTTPGVFRFTTAAVNASPNAPSVLSGVLEVRRVSTSVTAIQRYTPYNFGAQSVAGRVSFERHLVGSGWAPWRAFTSQRVDQSAGRAIYTWDDLNNREQLIYGDTGWRAVRSLLLNGWSVPSDSGAMIRRVGWNVSLTLVGLNSSAATDDAFLAAISGFRTGDVMWQPWPGESGSATDIILREQSGRWQRVNRNAGRQVTYATFSWITSEAWPSVLPGAAVGSVPNA